MEKIEIEKEKTKCNFSKIIVDQLNETLANPEEDFDKEINRVIKRMINISTRNLKEDEKSQKKFFDEVCNFLNSVFGNISIKKFYNTAPNKTLHEYADLSLWKQVVHNVYGKERRLFYRDQIWWWSCHHWTIFLNKIFDKLEKKWLKSSHRIAVYTDNGWHSMLLVEFQWQKYWADVFGDHEHNDLVRKVTKWDLLYDEKDLLRRHQIKYMNKNDFVEYIEDKPYKTIKVIFKPKLEDACSEEIEITINSEDLLVRVGWKSYSVFLKKWFKIPKKIPDTKLVDYLIQNSLWDKKSKEEIAKYLSIVRHKINPDKLKSIF